MKMNLVKYAGDFWITLADYTQTRDTEGYSDHASVKSAIRTYIVKSSPDKYIAFRGEAQIKNIIKENRNNPLFNPDDFKGHTRTALIHWSMVDGLNERFAIDKDIENEFGHFMEDAEEVIEDFGAGAKVVSDEDSLVEGRSAMLRRLRSELAAIDKTIESSISNKEKIQQAISALESLELDNLQ